ncbi:hypothetical protein B0H16DRAFT_1484259 [Mycena metata]|uniref:Uncharacterized protein n=1 Tax=Mycena metata TaxID=1033252 RepID=A0AAD7DU27_9AGAR|nr:hypothetical protein B0H16DRAFT_1484259 [Mycena metata]
MSKREQRSGQRPLTALEYDANLKWLRKYRDYSPSLDEQNACKWEERSNRELLEHPIYGSGARTLEVLAELRELRADEAWVLSQGHRPWVQETAQEVVSQQLRDWMPVHKSNMRIQDRLRQGIMTRRLIQRLSGVMDCIVPERANPSSRMAAQLRWNKAHNEAAGLSARLSWSMACLQAEHLSAMEVQDEAQTAIVATRAASTVVQESLNNPPRNWGLKGDGGLQFSRSPVERPRLPPREVVVRGQENVGALPVDEARYWADSIKFSNEELGALAPEIAMSESGNAEAGPSTRAMTDAEEYDWKYPGGLLWAQEQARLGAQHPHPGALLG